ncbi:CinA family protein [Cupriavidus agavae]|uniref:PncC family amidohydrolase n=1 Tax=Cupriavidus agavae TaxID=1001822 RepID=A0A4Q7RDY1_9BURK|nr:CinA family protein [Cupriavidus agavae]RZT31373.1 PncC family amidohydrolase [Cupriavidus agavae]
MTDPDSIPSDTARHADTDMRAIAHFLQRQSLTLATAESCTAGLIASRIAEVPGCGAVLRLAIVTYDPGAKTGVLHVPRETIDRHGLTSEAVSLAMARGMSGYTDASLVIANTGVADDGADDGTPPGTQCFAWRFRRGGAVPDDIEFSETRRFPGDRNEIRMAAASYALSRVQHYHTLAARR